MRTRSRCFQQRLPQSRPEHKPAQARPRPSDTAAVGPSARQAKDSVGA